MPDQPVPTPDSPTSAAPLPQTAAIPTTPATPAPVAPAADWVQVGKYKVRVDRGLCIGAASCVAVSPTTFQLDAEKKAVIQQGSTETPENILMAAQSCPTKAIIVIDTETGKQVWPE